MTIDPVCSCEVDEMMAGKRGLSSEHSGHVYLFCSSECKERFEHDPDAYATSLPAWEDPDQPFRSWPVE